jgi:hypothetical protein
MIKIDMARAIELFQEIVDEAGPLAGYEFPDGKDGGCLYVHRIRQDGSIALNGYHRDEYSELKPGCIVGQALVKAGVPIESLTWEFEGSFGYSSVAFLRDDDLAEVTPEARVFMGAVQQKQDKGRTWADSLSLALSEHGL